MQRTGRGLGIGRGRRGTRRFAMGPDGDYRCPSCGHIESYYLGEPCYIRKCPKCGAPLTRA